MSQRKRDHRLSLDQAKRISRSKVLSHSRGSAVRLSDGTLAKIIGFIASVASRRDRLKLLPQEAHSTKGYYSAGLDWINEDISDYDFVGLYIEACREIPEFETAFECISELHKRRTKYQDIMSRQPMTALEHISPRSILEYGLVPDKALGAWLVLRKFFYDLDNRSAQETGYLFEPILASSLGGEPYSAKGSPITRNGDGETGRQIDCIVDTRAYEFKLRVTEASSGRARFEDELQLPWDCAACGYRPTLIVLDDEDSQKSRKISASYIEAGGEAFFGKDAWDHIREEAGPTMAAIVESFVRDPLEAVEGGSCQIESFSVHFDEDQAQISMKVPGEEHDLVWGVKREG